jgi:hypothetical protein
MKKLFLYLSLGFFYIACNDEKKYSNEEADKRDYNKETKTEVGDRGVVTADTTNTSNNNAYNTDSASGQGNRFDTSSNNKGK